MKFRTASLLLLSALALSASGALASTGTEPAPCPDCLAPVIELRGPTPEDEAEIEGFITAALGPKFRLADYAAVGGPWLDGPVARQFERDVRRGNVTLPWGVMPDIHVENGQSPTSFIVHVGRKDDPYQGYRVSVTGHPSLGWRITGVGTYIH